MRPLIGITMFYKCNNFGHTTRNLRSRSTCSLGLSKETRQVSGQHKIWKKRKEDLQIDECGIVLQDQNTSSHWYIDSG